MKRITFLLALTITAVAQAQPLADHVPADATVYAAWTGVDELGAAYEQSKLKAVLDATNMAKLLTETVPAMMAEHADPESLALYKELGPAVWHRPWAFYLAGVDLNDDGEPMPRFGLLCRAGDYAATLEPQLQKLAAQMNKEDAAIGARVETHDGVLCLIAGSAGEGALTDTASFKSALERLPDGAGDAIVVYLDVAKLMDTIDRLIESEDDDESVSLAQWHDAREKLGLDDVSQFLTTGGFENTGWRWDSFVGAPAPRRGLIAAIEGEPIADEELQLIPSTATWLQVVDLDLGAVYDAVMDVIAIYSDEDAGDAQQAVAEASEKIGVNIPALIHRFASRWVMYNDPGVAGPMGMGICIINKPSEPQQMAADLSTLEQYANTMLASEGETAGLQFQFKTMQQGDLTIHTLATPFVSPSWAVAEDRLHVTLFPQAVVMAELYAKQEGNSILTNAKFTSLRDRLAGDAKSIGLIYIDLPQTAPASYNSYLSISQMLLSFLPPDAAAQSPGMLLPPLGMILPHLEPAGTAAWADADGLYLRSYVPFPGASMLSQNSMTFGGGGASMTAMSVGILLPALGAARRTARQMQSNTQARGLHQAAVMWSVSHDGHFPDELYPLLDGNFITVDYVISPTSDVEIPADFDNWPKDQQRNWVRANASYVLLPGKTETLDTDEVQLFSKPSPDGDEGISVSWGDNHTNFERDVDMIDQIVQQQTGKTLAQHVVESERPIDAAETPQTPPAPDGAVE